MENNFFAQLDTFQKQVIELMVSAVKYGRAYDLVVSELPKWKRFLIKRIIRF